MQDKCLGNLSFCSHYFLFNLFIYFCLMYYDIAIIFLVKVIFDINGWEGDFVFAISNVLI